ncbi:MAG TPA: aldolase/citrate lyase family protein [Microlunatus sp.]|nr:aldolase/citrate lyase family protein [Microlunatus sp.]
MSLKSRARNGEKLLGVLLRMPAEELVEMVALSGFDFLLIDCEHGPADLIPLRQHIALAAVHGVQVVVRIGSHEPALALRVLDQGATGIVAPHVDDVATARALVDAVHYPPLGRRGFATYSRAGRFGLADPATHKQRMLDDTLVVGMIESPSAAAAAADILAVPGIDGTMIGTADLGASRTETDPPIAELVASVNSVLAASPALRMDIVTGPDKASAAFADGADLVVYNLAHTLMGHLADLRDAHGSGSAPRLGGEQRG